MKGTLEKVIWEDIRLAVAAVYYSLQHPTTINFSPRSRKQASTLFDLRELRHIMNVFIEEIQKNKARLSGTIAEKIPKHVVCDYFHNKEDQHNEIKLTDVMPLDDTHLITSLYPQNTSNFASNGTFVRGCVRIKHKNNVTFHDV